MLIIDFLLVVIFLFYQRKFQIIAGIYRIDQSIGNGITPDKALSLCKNNIKFLGIASNKLVSSPEFEKAIKRCNRPQESIKFLLASSENPILKQAASRAGRDVSEYKDKVTYTLNKLSSLKKEFGYNIEVRLYTSGKESGPPSFRLFFIDNTSVLVSYYIFGEGDGLQMPQIQVFKPKKKRDVENFYYAFDHYFNSLWEMSDPYLA